jgi:hypothetical protein
MLLLALTLAIPSLDAQQDRGGPLKPLRGKAPVAVGSVALAGGATSIVGQVTQFVVTLRDAAGRVLTLPDDITWTSSAPTVAKATGVGGVTAVNPGTATLTATSGGKSAAVTVTVTPPALTFTPAAAHARVGQAIYVIASLALTPVDQTVAQLVRYDWSYDGPSMAIASPGLAVGTSVNVPALQPGQQPFFFSGRSPGTATFNARCGQASAIACTPATLTVIVDP